MRDLISLGTLLSFHRGGQTPFQNDRFVTVQAGGTPYGCLVQALRELWKRFRGLRDDFCRRDLLRLDIEQLEAKASEDSFRGRRARVRLAQKRLQVVEVEKHIETDGREFLQFYSQAAALYAHLEIAGQAHEQIERLDRERWEHRALSLLASDCMTRGGPQANTIEMVQSLPPDSRAKILRRAFGPDPLDRKANAKHVESLVQWYLNYTPDLPAPLSLTQQQAAALLSDCESGHFLRQLRISSTTVADSSAENNSPNDWPSASRAPGEVV